MTTIESEVDLVEIIKSAVRQERERCAQLTETFASDKTIKKSYRQQLAAAMRAGMEPLPKPPRFAPSLVRRHPPGHATGGP